MAKRPRELVPTCAGCGRAAREAGPAGFAVCPWCGAVPRGFAGARRRNLAIGLFLAVLGGAALWASRRPVTPDVDFGPFALEWTIAPAAAPPPVERTVYVAVPPPARHLGAIRHAVSASCARHLESDPAHLHAAAAATLRAAGADAYHSDPPLRIADDRFEVLTHAFSSAALPDGAYSPP